MKNEILKKENFYFLMIVSLIFLLDRYSKIQIINNLNEKNLYINDFVNINLVWNTGIGFGFFSTSSNLIYNSITGIICIVIIFLIYLILKSKMTEKILFSMILGGAIGNVYDRLTYFAVPDFIDIHYNNFHWFTFNIADIFITLGIILIIFNDILFKKNEN
ncbi:MAG: signal peptidase II [Candidatus Pelagibacter sp. TMED165]|nr:MAG: signal peptidase II [Candidatus Pelagibacter sp. TMED165]|tara:strand:+ start:982 stop:1464 length:483 start_codon:yes stop_codon:yes gene_type:complete